ncbi:MAG TPA: NAD-binding protein [Gaiellales bacterium]
MPRPIQRRVRGRGFDGRPVTLAHFALVALAATLLVVGGTVGYRLVLDEGVLAALYRTVNTITTAGEVTPATTTGGRIVTITLLMSGVAVFLYAVGITIELVVGGVVSGAWTRRRMEARIARLTGHLIICGYGRVGGTIAEELIRSGREFVVVDSNEDATAHAAELGHPFVSGSGEDDDVLAGAGLERAAGLVACVDDDAANTYIVLTAKGLRPDLRVVARASNNSAAAKLRRAGADEVVSPYEIAGERIAGVLLTDVEANRTRLLG